MLSKLSSSLGVGSFHCRLIGAFLRLSTTTTAAASAAVEDNPSPLKHHFIVEEYLISQCGLSPAEATKASQRLSHLKSPQKPDSVLGFMRSQGFDDTQIRKIVSSSPKFLCIDVEKTLAPKFRSLQDLGFSGSDLTHLVLLNPSFLHLSLPTILLRIEFWSRVISSTDHLIKLFKKGRWFLTSNIEKAIPNLSLLRDWGISDRRIALAVRKDPKFILREPETFKALAEHVKGLGVPRCSGNFLWAIWALHAVSKAKFNANLKLMRSFGWSEADFHSAFCKAPIFLTVSQKKLSEKMDFLVKEAGCEPSYITRFPVLLMYSLERRLIPRHHVMKTLKTSGLLSREFELASIMILSEKVFMEKYVVPHKEKVPLLQEMYMAGCGKGDDL